MPATADFAATLASRCSPKQGAAGVASLLERLATRQWCCRRSFTRALPPLLRARALAQCLTSYANHCQLGNESQVRAVIVAPKIARLARSRHGAPTLLTLVYRPLCCPDALTLHYADWMIKWC